MSAIIIKEEKAHCEALKTHKKRQTPEGLCRLILFVFQLGKSRKACKQ